MDLDIPAGVVCPGLGLIGACPMPAGKPIFFVIAALLALPRLGLPAEAPSTYDPHVLSVIWPDGRREEIAATSAATCEAGRQAIEAGLWLVDPDTAISPATSPCRRGNLFPPGSDCIEKFNCGRKR